MENKDKVPKNIEELKSIFENNPEENNKAISIFAVLTSRIRNEVMPDVEKLIGSRVKRFFIIPRRLNNDERKVLLGLLCELPLLRAIYDIRNILKHEKGKADRINSYLVQIFSAAFGITNDDMLELEEAASEGSRVINIAMWRICERLNCRDLSLSMMLGIVCIEKLSLIEAETVKMLCVCPKEDLIKNVRDNVKW